MNLNRRIDKLEHVRATEPQQCMACGFPQRGRRTVILSDNDDPLPECAACHQPLDEDGVPLYTPLTQVILE